MFVVFVLFLLFLFVEHCMFLGMLFSVGFFYIIFIITIFQFMTYVYCDLSHNQNNYCYFVIVRLPNTNFHKKTAYYEDFMKLSGIEGNIYGLNLRRGAHSSGHYFQDGRHFSKWPPFIEVRTLQMIEITDFNDLSVD